MAEPSASKETAASEASPHGQHASAQPASDFELQLKEKDSKYLYLYAEFENYKKRAIKERSDAMKFGWENVARDLLEVTDNLERALAHMPQSTDKNLAEGLKMTLTQFRSALQKQGVAQIETVGKPFDPEFHDAVGQEPSEHSVGLVSREELKGYTLHGRLLRPASVVVSAGPLAK